jgi:hypothetical protein
MLIFTVNYVSLKKLARLYVCQARCSVERDRNNNQGVLGLTPARQEFKNWLRYILK